MNNNRVKGVRDLMESHRFQWKHIAKAMIDAGVPGGWDNPQNVYNLANGSIIPRDAYVYVVLSKLFDTSVETILSRYTVVNRINSVFSEEKVERHAIDFDDDNLF